MSDVRISNPVAYVPSCPLETVMRVFDVHTSSESAQLALALYRLKQL
jgi:hypothetical protein